MGRNTTRGITEEALRDNPILYSIRMRASCGGAHETGGRHISGAERLATRERIAAITQDMQERAFTHSRGQADFINIKVEAVAPKSIIHTAALAVSTRQVSDLPASRVAAREELALAGVSSEAMECGIGYLENLADSMRGAMLVCCQSGRRLDDNGLRGVRVSRMDMADEIAFTNWLATQGLENIHTREALILATKVASAPGMVAELCWSDDPDYTTGYVASAHGYVRLPHCKPLGLPQGGRIFFVQPGADIAAIVTYLERSPVLIAVPKEAIG